MTDLADRIEKATGPSYTFDCEIWDLIYPGERQARFDKLTAPGTPYHKRLGPADLDGYVRPLRNFTASLDAALTLVPEGWEPTITVRHGRRSEVYLESPDRGRWRDTGGFAATPALAICAAALRARENSRDHH
jgi:hypothetical protein